MLDFTLAIRTYNGAKRLPSLLEKLKTQIQVENIQWEVVIVDNNSSDNTAEVIQTYQLEWPDSYPLRYFFEPQQGAAIARRRAFEEARGRWIGFLDDDNIPTEDWVYQAYRFSQSHPSIGAYGGQIHAEFEVQPPPNFQRIAVYLALIERGNREFCYNQHKQKVLPPGTNLVIAKQAWLEAVPQKMQLLGPTGNSLNAKGEDIEMLSHIRKAGWEIWYAPAMQCFHKIPAWRLERKYLLDFAWGTGLSRYRLRMVRLTNWQKVFMPWMYWLNDFRKLLSALVKNHKMLDRDISSAFEVTLLASIFFSPIYSLWGVDFGRMLNSNHE